MRYPMPQRPGPILRCDRLFPGPWHQGLHTDLALGCNGVATERLGHIAIENPSSGNWCKQPEAILVLICSMIEGDRIRSDRIP